MNEIYLGLMSGTSLDAIDAVAVLCAQNGHNY
jgi:1,6-anhydro-N-acetylmuramate kinase